MTAKIEIVERPAYHKIVVPTGRRMQIYIRNDGHATRALCEIAGPATISCVEVEIEFDERQS
jgi:hypothetical protein